MEGNLNERNIKRVILVLVAVHTTLAQQCYSPYNEPGYCVTLPSCVSLIQSTQNGHFSKLVSIISYISQSLCGYNGAELLVCCPQQLSFINSQQQLQQQQQQVTAPFTFLPLPTEAFTFNHPGATNPPIVVPPIIEPVAPIQPQTSDSVCGISNFTSTRVVGGANAKLNQYPWIAALAYRIEPDNQIRIMCAGSLISQRHVLTTAHCISQSLAFVRLGEHDLSSNTDGANPIDVNVARVTVHEDYVANIILNDIAMLTLDRLVPINAQIRPICLPVNEPLRSRDLTGYQPFLAGWGTTTFQGAASSVLQETQIPIVPTIDCERNYRAYFPSQVFDRRILCAGTGGKDACQGDSGGPLMLPESLSSGTYYYVLIGLVSYGYECARDGFPGVFTRITEFLPWIQQKLNTS